MLQVNRQSWHARIYRWWYRHKYDAEPRQNTNLCPYMRTVMFWAPLRFLLGNWVKLYQWSEDGYVSLNMITIPILAYVVPKLVGYVSYTSKVILFALEGTFLGAGLAVFLCLGLQALGKKLAEVHYQHRKFMPRKSKTGPTFRDLLGAYIRANHDRICPEIELK